MVLGHTKIYSYKHMPIIIMSSINITLHFRLRILKLACRIFYLLYLYYLIYLFVIFSLKVKEIFQMQNTYIFAYRLNILQTVFNHALKLFRSNILHMNPL